jgi:hypothetical protein
VTPALLRFAGAAAATLAALCAAGAWPTWKLAAEDGLVAMGVAAGLSLLGAVVGFLPSASAQSATYAARMSAATLGIAVRLFVTLVGVFVALQVLPGSARWAFVAWVGIDYLTLVVVEIRLVLRPGRGTGHGGPASA